MAQLNVRIEVTRADWVQGAVTTSAYALAALSYVMPNAAVEWLREKVVIPAIVKFGFSIKPVAQN